jgi:hypothetical protein
MLRWRWWIWGAYVTAWTVALIYPVVPQVGLEGTPELLTIRMIVAKTVHISAYAVLAALTGWVRAPMRYRALLVFFLMAHGTATEMTQLAMEELGWSARHGELHDVAFDNLGILIGILAGWKWWMEES